MFWWVELFGSKLLIIFYVLRIMLKCRQKTRDFSAQCKNMKGNKLCTINFCHKCLLNRLDLIINFYFWNLFLWYHSCWGLFICFWPICLTNVDLDMERKQKRWQCWMTGNVPGADAFAIAVSACKWLMMWANMLLLKTFDDSNR